MFSKKKTTTKKFDVPTVETRTVTVEVPTAQSIKDMIVPAVISAAAAAKEYTADAKEHAGEYLEQGKAVAGEAAHQAKEKMSDNEKLSALIASGTAVGGEAARRSHDAALVLKGDAVIKPKKKGHPVAKLFANLGLLTVLGAVAAFVAQKMQQPKDDPWARPLTDPYVAPAAGRDATVAGGEGVKVATVGEQADKGTASTTTTESSETGIIAPQGQVRVEGDKH